MFRDKVFFRHPLAAKTITLALAVAIAFSGMPACTVQAVGAQALQEDDSSQAGNFEPIESLAPPKTYDTSEHVFVNKWLKTGQFMPISQVKPGMTGYGLTVFQGNRVERFDVTVIGTVKKVLNGRDAILVRLAGENLGKNTVIRGMSGSPVYIGGKLIGAISYGFDFSKEPIVGITPIVDMLDALAQSDERAGGRGRAISVHPRNQDGIEGSDPNTTGRSNISGGAPRMVPLMAPVALAGFSPRAEAFLADRFKSFGMMISSGAAGGMDPSLEKVFQKPKAGQVQKNASPDRSAPKSANASTAALAGSVTATQPIQPGGAVSVMLSTGDFASSATGTATATFGGNVLAFGHPFLQAGSVDFPMATAYIHKVLPSLAVSFKVASPVKVVGSITSDRPWSVGGQVGKFSRLIPATYTVVDKTRNVRRTFHCNVVDHPDLTPELLAATAMSAIDATHQSSGPYVVKIASVIDTENVGAIKRTDRFSTNFTPHALTEGGGGKFRVLGDPVGGFVLATASRILDNDFEQAAIKSINLDIVLEDGHNTARIERIYVDKPVVEPGETIDLHCVLRPYNHETVIKSLPIKIPRDVPDGNLLIGVSSGDELDSVRKRMGLVDPIPETLSQIIKRIQEAGRGDAINAVLALPEQSVQLGHHKLIDPPAHWSRLFFSDRYTRGPSLIKGEIRSTLVQDWLVDGSHIMTVEVRRPEKALAQATPYMVSTLGPHSSEGIYMTDMAKKTLDSTRKSDSTSSAVSQAIQSVVAQAQSTTSSDAKSASSGPKFWNPPKGYPHMRSVQMWLQESEEDFRAGKTDGTTIDSWGRIAPAYQDIAQKSISTDMQVWSGVYSGGYFWFATPDSIYKWKGDATAPELVLKLSTALIPAMAADSRGIIYAACAPDGTIISIDPNRPITRNASGKAVASAKPGANPGIVYKASEAIITCLTFDDKNNMYAGVAGGGKVYKIDGSRRVTTLFDSGQAHVVSLFYSRPEGRIYVGTAEKGCVYSIGDSGDVKAEYQSSDHIVTGIARDAKGNLFVATAGSGHLVRVRQTGEVDSLASSESFYTLFYDASQDSVFSGDAEGDITKAHLDPMSGLPYFIPVCHTEQEAVMAMSSDGRGRLFAGTSNLARVRSFEMRPSSTAVYNSTIHDAQRPSRWSRLRAFGAYNESNSDINKQVLVETRTGETSQPDKSWTDWQAAESSSDGYLIKSKQGRYLQYRLSWKRAAAATQKAASAIAADPPVVGKVEVTYLPTNLAPQFSSISLKPGTAVSGKPELNISASDTDCDNLVMNIDISSDGARTWTVVAGDIRSKKTDSGKSDSSDKDKDKDKDKSADKSPEKASDKDKSHKSADKTSDSSKENKSGKANQNSDDKSTDKANDKPQDEATEKSDDKPLNKARESDKSSDRSAPNAVTRRSQESLASDGSYLEKLSDNEKEPAADTKKKGDKSNDKNADKKKDDAQSGKSGHASASKNDRNKSKLTTQSGKPPIIVQLGAQQGDTQGPVEKFNYTFDTTRLKDGNYVLRFVVDDKLSNPQGSSQSTAFRSLVIDNSPPTIDSVKVEKMPGGVELVVQAKDSFTPIANATYRIDGGAPLAMTGLNQVADGLSVSLGAGQIKLEKGKHELEVEVTDKAGNTVKKSVSVN